MSSSSLLLSVSNFHEPPKKNICNHQADSPLYVWPDVWFASLEKHGQTWYWMSLHRREGGGGGRSMKLDMDNLSTCTPMSLIAVKFCGVAPVQWALLTCTNSLLWAPTGQMKICVHPFIFIEHACLLPLCGRCLKLPYIDIFSDPTPISACCPDCVWRITSNLTQSIG